MLLTSCGMRGDRYQNAKDEKEMLILNQLDELNIEPENLNVYLRAFKEEEILEVWVSSSNHNYKEYTSYPFCTSSGHLGPKRKEGDRQIPEGIYQINRYNPESKFHLSLGINYPNEADLLHADTNHPGSDIFIHGGCSSVGCISITDDSIKELYTLASMSKVNTGAPIRVDIYPYQLTTENHLAHQQLWAAHNALWSDLQNIYTHFQKEKKVTPIHINKKGRYQRDENN